MKAPDKIYVAKATFPNYVDWDGSPINTKRVSNNDICYVHKDALMEWAKDNLLECEVSNDETDYGRIDVYKKLIEKLNSL